MVIKCLSVENLQTLKIEVEEDTRRLKGLPCPWIIKVNIVKMILLLIAIQYIQ